MIIVEGCDNTGKTTLIDKLCEAYGLTKAKPPGPAPREELIEFMKGITLMTRKQGTNIIVDRFPLYSEPVYGVTLRGVSALTVSDYQRYEAQLRIHDPLIIYCTLPIGKIRETFAEREQLSGVEDNLQKIIDGYERLWDTIQPKRLVRYNFTNPESYQAIEDAVGAYLFIQSKEVMR